MSLSRHTLATASAVMLIATLAACGGGNDPEAAEPDLRIGPGGGRPPGASGEVADVSGRTAQVQGPSGGQVAVTWTGDTTFTEDVDGSLDDVVVGACVMVMTEDDVAETVRVTEADDDGGCGLRGPGTPPEGAPTDLPSDLPDRRGSGTVGEVTAVATDGFTVSAQEPGADEPTDQVVAVDDGTVYTTTAAAKAAAVQVGRCVDARGESDDTGAVTATSIRVSDPVDGECQGGTLSIMRPGGGAA